MGFCEDYQSRYISSNLVFYLERLSRYHVRNLMFVLDPLTEETSLVWKNGNGTMAEET
jgi:hypothetical protein